MAIALIQEKFMLKAKEKYGNKYNYDEVVFTKSVNKVRILCCSHQEFFEQTIYNHLLGQDSCKICLAEIKNQKIRKLQDDFEIRA